MVAEELGMKDMGNTTEARATRAEHTIRLARQRSVDRRRTELG